MHPRTDCKKKITIDGNIGSGKTTQLNLLRERLGYTVYKEPIQEWPLKLFYEDKKRWAFLLQLAILKSFHDSQDGDGGGVWERSPESSREVFWKMLRGSYTDEEDDVYRYFYELFSWEPDVHVYIRTDPDECFERISKRHQEGDSKIDVEYLRSVHEFYEEYVRTKKDVRIIDGNKSSEEIHDEIVRCIRGAQA